MPELEKQKIVYESLIKESTENQEIELLINEEIFKVTLDTVIETTQKQHEDAISKERSKVNLLLGQVKMFEEELTSHQNTISTLEGELDELKSVKDNLEAQLEEFRQKEIGWLKDKSRITELESEVERLNEDRANLETKLQEYDQREQNTKEELIILRAAVEETKQLKEFEEEERLAAKADIEQLTNVNKELSEELSRQMTEYVQVESERDDFKSKWEVLKSRVDYYRNLASQK